MKAEAVVVEKPERVQVARLPISTAGDSDVIVDIDHSGISTGTERLLWSGRMPSFPGMGYPLVPGYESVGRVVEAGLSVDLAVGDRVFVPGASCFGDVRGLFGGAASRLVTSAKRVAKVSEKLGENAVLLALAATARHAMTAGHAIGQADAPPPDLIVGHGVLGRLLARLACLMPGPTPVVWEANPARTSGAIGYDVIDPKDDDRHDYRSIYDVSGDASLLNSLIARLAPGGEIVLAGFYSDPLSFAFAPAFMREARIRIAAEWKPDDLDAVNGLVEQGSLSLDGLITHRHAANAASEAYETAFDDPACLKMILDWRTC